MRWAAGRGVTPPRCDTRGARNGQSRLTAKQVAAIRRAAGRVSQRVLAKRYRVFGAEHQPGRARPHVAALGLGRVGGDGVHIEAEWDAGLALEVPVRIVCDARGKARALSTPTAVLVAGADWVEQSEEFRQHHHCGEDRRREPGYA
jgi:hypothetical protein